MKHFDGEHILNEDESDILHIEVTDDEGRIGVLSMDNVFAADWKDHDGRHQAVADACARGNVCEISFGDDCYHFAAEEDIAWHS